MSSKNKFKSIENLEITAISSEGKGIGRHEGKVIFVDYALPGDIVDVQLKRSHKKYEQASILSIRQASPNRVNPYCDYFGTCGGCKVQHFDYPGQMEWKRQIVSDALTKIGHLEYNEILPTIGGEQINRYRNKLDYAASNKRWLSSEEISSLPPDADRSGIGFHIAGMFDKVLDIETCHHMNEPANDIKNAIRSKAKELNIPFFDIRNQTGNLRNILLRNSSIGEFMVCISFFDYNDSCHQLMQYLADSFSEITSLLYTQNNKKNDVIYDLDIHTFKGKNHIIEQLGDLQFKIGPKSFFQTNSKQCLVLYNKIKELANLTKTETVYDLYTGVGSIGIFVASEAKKVVGIELIEEAIVDAKMNAALNQIENTEFYASDTRNLLNRDFVAKHGRPDLIITDPPRAGMHPDVVHTLLEIESPHMIYVSCNPVTLAQDLSLLIEKYEIQSIQPFDLFPQTAHIETIVDLKLKSK
jgi:23S rRNA (uracil1939-C5)-methyltransferase